ncbi:YceD family protein [Methylobacterium aerolatum]|uniref:Metal-binding protein n=1 Tax=Methylobacterium aerolatum TaxID=418708 RepID=A0ABU0HWG8_9HYPH|nr:YceD family protein [Methylobacterium aerolatum]MDQ0446232.1 hypothetical protein [Methylobacterium aerolatum]GJD35575.1 hypothetical protein FMGBMHLM_2487 [Methylobacterium aerolatum]
MSPRPASPLSRPVDVGRLPRGRAEVTVEATPEECATLAADFGIPALRDLVGRFVLSGTTTRLTVTGTVEARVTQVCTVTLEPFESSVREPVEVVYSDVPPSEEPEEDAAENAPEPPDPIVNGRIDLGALTAEFLALGLDPYPRKPGVAFEPVASGEESGAFAALGRLRNGQD